jgi:hypothetical protein
MKTPIIGMRLTCAAFGAAFCLANSVVAQDDHWAGTPNANGELWNVPGNWSEGIVPTNGCDFAGNVWLDPANGDSIITIPAGFVAQPGVPQCGEGDTFAFNTIFGPEFGVTLNDYGHLQWAWTMAPYSPDPGVRSTINMYNGSSMYTDGASINLGDGWWNGPQFGNHTTMNMYGNAQYSSVGGAGIWFGAHMNIYDTANVLINGYVNMDFAYGESDGTRSIVLGGGSMTLPEGTITGGNSGSAASWITRGILRAWGKGEDSTDVSITDNGTNTIVTVTPLSGSLQRVYFGALVKASVPIGTVQQLTLSGDYLNVSGVYLSSTEPGLDPASFPAPTYTSSNPGVVSVDSHGVATANGPGTATITATVGALHSTNSVTITVTDNPPALAHRYSFTASSGTSVPDSAGGASPATLVGGATLGGGQVTLDGSTGYVQLPAGIVTGMDVITVETWASFANPGNVFSCLWCLGYADQTGDANDGFGGDYLNVQLDNGGASTVHQSFGQGTPGFNGETDADTTASLDGLNNVQVVAVFNPYAGTETLYTNGVFAARADLFNNMLDPVAFSGPTYNGESYLAYIMNNQVAQDGGGSTGNPNNYIGWDDYQGNANAFDPPTINPDPTMKGSVSEFRIYSSALNASQVAADYALGPTKLLGTSLAHPTLHATLVGGNIVITWPTTSAYVTLVSGPYPGPGPWTPVTNGTLTIVGSNYQETIPASAAVGLSFALE